MSMFDTDPGLIDVRETQTRKATPGRRQTLEERTTSGRKGGKLGGTLGGGNQTQTETCDHRAFPSICKCTWRQWLAGKQSFLEVKVGESRLTLAHKHIQSLTLTQGTYSHRHTHTTHTLFLHTHAHSRPPLNLQVFLGVLGRILCIRRDSFMQDEPTPSSHSDATFRRLDDMTHAASDATDVGGGGGVFDSAPDDRAKMFRTYAQITSEAEWRQLAAILDRCFLILFSILVVVISFMFGH